MKIRSLLTALLPSIWMIVSGSLGVQAADLLPPADLRCEFLINPQGIEFIQSNRVLAGDLSGPSEAKRKRPIAYWWLPSRTC